MRFFENKIFLNSNNNFYSEIIFIMKQNFKKNIYYLIAMIENVLYIKI